MAAKLVVISMDAMISEDIPNLNRHPVFHAFLKDAACVQRVKSIYPTLTYPCHTTMISGLWPDRHGVTANEAFLPGISPLPWLFEHSAVRCRDLFDLCKANGLTTAAVGWPVTGNHPSIDWLVDEIWTVGTPWTKESMRETLLAAGTAPEVYECAVKPFEDLRVPRRQPASSFFNMEAACAILKEFRPDVLMIHTGNFDSYRHKKGVVSDLTEKAAEESDRMLWMLLAAIEETGKPEEYNIVITSDHGQLDFRRYARPNVLLAENGFISLREDGSVKEWRAWCLSAGMSAQIFLKDPYDRSLYKEVHELLEERRRRGDAGFSVIYTADELKEKEHLAGDFSFVLETDGETAFQNAWSGPYFVPAVCEPGTDHAGAHGFHPDKGPRPVLLGRGPAFRENAFLENADLVDLAPTFAAALGLALPDADGRVLTEILA